MNEQTENAACRDRDEKCEACGMTQEREGRILEQAIETCGEDAQIDMMIEEMSELTQALPKLRRAKRCGCSAELCELWRDAVREGMADVGIMLNQRALTFGDVTDMEIAKLERPERRIVMARGHLDEKPEEKRWKW